MNAILKIYIFIKKSTLTSFNVCFLKLKKIFLIKCSNRGDIQFGTIKKISILRSSYTLGHLIFGVLGTLCDNLNCKCSCLHSNNISDFVDLVDDV